MQIYHVLLEYQGRKYKIFVSHEKVKKKEAQF